MSYSATITGGSAPDGPSYVAPSSATCFGYSNGDPGIDFGSSSPQPIVPGGDTVTGVFEIQGFGSVVVCVAILGSHPQDLFDSLTLTKTGGSPITYLANAADYADAGSTTAPTYTFGSADVTVWVWNTGGNDFLSFDLGVDTLAEFALPAVSCDPYFGDVSILLSMDGTQGSTTFVDTSNNAFPMSVAGVPAIDTADPKFGTGAVDLGVAFGADGVFTSFTPGSALDLGAGDFTVEGWFNSTQAFGYGSMILAIYDDPPSVSYGAVAIIATGSDTIGGLIKIGGTQYPFTAVLIDGTPGIWHSFAACRQGTSLYFFVDGVSAGVTACPSGALDFANTLIVGGLSGTANHFPGEIDEIRVTKGVARYTADYFPPVDAFPTVACGITIPDVVGEPVVTASADIVSAGCTVGTITFATSLTVPSGDIISQNPAGGTVVPSGVPVDLVQSSGLPTVTVPDVVGELLATGESDIVAAGLVTGTVTTANSLTVPAGHIISENPAAGSSALAGDAVDLVNSLGVANPPVPDVTTLSSVDAQETIVAAGFTVGTISFSPDAAPPGTVISQTPTGGTAEPLGTPVDIVLAAGTTGTIPNMFTDEAFGGAYFGGVLNLVEFTYLPERTPFEAGATNLVINRYKQEPGDVRQRGVSFRDFMVPGETIQTVAVSGIKAQGVDQTATDPLVTPLVVNGLLIDPAGQTFAYTVSGGQDGIEYTVQFTTTTSIQTTTPEEIFSINIMIEDMFP